MKRTIGVLCGWLALALPAAAADAPVALVSADATSSAKGSVPVSCLLDAKCAGTWSPASVDAGHDEGIYLLFAEKLTVNMMEVVASGTPEDLGGVGIQAYFDGKTTTSGEQVVFPAHAAKNAAGETSFVVASRAGALRARASSVFVKFVDSPYAKVSGKTPRLTRIRFYREYQPPRDGEKWGPRNPLAFAVPRIVPATVTATSILSPASAFDPAHLFDSSLSLAWATDGASSPGKGESFKVQLGSPQAIAALMVWNGYQRSATHYAANARVAALEVTADGGAPQAVKLADVNGRQLVKLPKPLEGVSNLTFTIAELYRGTKYKDVLISELRLVGPNGEIIVPEAVAPTPTPPDRLRPLLDRSYASFMHQVAFAGGDEYIDACANSTIRLRGNGTFVIYKDFDYGRLEEAGKVSANVLEGNWEPKGDALRIFGKKYTTSLRSAEYLGVKEAGQASIFHSDLTITPFKELSAAKRASVMRFLFGRLGATGGGPGDVLWYTGIPLDPAQYQNRFGPGPEKAVLAAAEKELLRREPLYVESSAYTELLLPTDSIRLCSYGGP